MEALERKAALEAILFAAGEPVAASRLALVLGVTEAEVDAKVAEYAAAYDVATENTDAIRFYEAHGFRLTEKKQFEEGTTEYLVMMER